MRQSVWRRYRALVSSVCSGTSVRRLRREVHGDGRRGAVQHCRVRTLLDLAEFAPSVRPAKCHWWNAVTLDTPCFVVSKSFSRRLSKLHKFRVHSADCYWVGFQSSAIEGGTNLDRPANCVFTLGFRRWRPLARGVCDRSARGTKFAPELFLRNVTGEKRSPWTLPVVVVSKKFREVAQIARNSGAQCCMFLVEFSCHLPDRVLASRLCSHFSSRH